MLAYQQTAIENTANLKMIKAPEFAKDVACKESRESHGILKKVLIMSVLIIQSQIYFSAILFQVVYIAFLLRTNKDHGTDCNLGKLHVCLQLYFTYSIYHLQTIPQRNMYRTFEKEMKI